MADAAPPRPARLHVLVVDVSTHARRDEDAVRACLRASFLKAQLCMRNRHARATAEAGNEAKGAQVAVVLLGTTETNNKLADAAREGDHANDYANISVARDFADVDGAMLDWLFDGKDLLASHAPAPRADWLDALAVACHLARTSATAETKGAHITLYSPCLDDVDGEEIGDAAFLLHFLGDNSIVKDVDFVAVDARLGTHKPHAGIVRAQELARGLAQQTSARFEVRCARTYSEVCAVRLEPNIFREAKRQIKRLHFGRAGWFSIDIALYYKTSPQALPQSKNKGYVRDTRYKSSTPTKPTTAVSEPTAPVSPLDRVKNREWGPTQDVDVRDREPARSWALPVRQETVDTEFGKSRKEGMLANSTLKLDAYGRDKIPRLPEEHEHFEDEWRAKSALRAGDAKEDAELTGALTILRIVPRHLVPRHSWLGQAMLVCAREDHAGVPNEVARLGISALCHELERRDAVAIARSVVGEKDGAELGVLAPYRNGMGLPPDAVTNRVHHDALLWARLPFTDDVRIANHMEGPPPNASPTEQQTDAARRIVELLDLNNALAPEQTPNPIMQHFHVGLHNHSERPRTDEVDVVVSEVLLERPVPSSKRGREELEEALKALQSRAPDDERAAKRQK